MRSIRPHPSRRDRAADNQFPVTANRRGDSIHRLEPNRSGTDGHSHGHVHHHCGAEDNDGTTSGGFLGERH
jgi:hypothetical protein